MRELLWVTRGLGRGGAEHLIVQGAEFLLAEGVAVEVAYTLAAKDALVPRLREAGAVVHALGDDSQAGRWAPRLAALVRRTSADVIHTHAPLPAAVARLVAPRSAALVHTEHNQWQRYHPVTRAANAATFRRNNAVIAVSDAVATSIPGGALRAGASLHTLHHGPDVSRVRSGPDARKAARRTLGLSDESFVVGTVGNLTPKKDQATLLRAMASVPGTEAVIIGTGPLETELRTLADQLGVGSRVRFAGSRSDVPDVLAGFDVFALTSRHEGQPLAVQEAMAAGLPVVATAVGGLPEIVQPERNGLLVPAGDPAAVTAAIARLQADPALAQRLGDRARSAALTGSSTEVWKAHLALYEELW